MRKASKLPDLERLNYLFSYNPETGLLTRKVDVPKAKAGTIAGTLNSTGHLIVRINYKIYFVHRIAWFMFYKKEPPLFLDHKNRNSSDNRIKNLRSATAAQNTFNRKTRAKSGAKGVDLCESGKWRAAIKFEGKYIYLGRFKTKEEAAEAYVYASRQYHGEHGSF